MPSSSLNRLLEVGSPPCLPLLEALRLLGWPTFDFQMGVKGAISTRTALQGTKTEPKGTPILETTHSLLVLLLAHPLPRCRRTTTGTSGCWTSTRTRCGAPCWTRATAWALTGWWAGASGGGSWTCCSSGGGKCWARRRGGGGGGGGRSRRDRRWCDAWEKLVMGEGVFLSMPEASNTQERRETTKQQLLSWIDPQLPCLSGWCPHHQGKYENAFSLFYSAR